MQLSKSEKLKKESNLYGFNRDLVIEKYRTRDSTQIKTWNLAVNTLKGEVSWQCPVQTIEIPKRKTDLWISQKITCQNEMCRWV